MNKKNILVVDDEINIVKVIREELRSEGFIVDVAYDGNEASEKIKGNRYDVVILDIRMPKKGGIQVLKEIKINNPDIIVIIMTAYGSIENAVEAMKVGAYDYLTKPFDSSELTTKIHQALKIREKLNSGSEEIEDVNVELLGESIELERIKVKIEKIKDLGNTVLLTGESGTGKGVVAKVIHCKSNRRKLPFIHVNCAVLPENLIESELFGHEKGSFTGASDSKKGKFELAGKGTIFLDEIGTLSPKLQAKLLTVLQEKKIDKIGGNRPIKVNARIIAATNENLEEAVKSKVFREDLYYRLNVITIECIPLRHRKEDIEILTDNFLKKTSKKFDKKGMEISKEVLNILKEYEWPGNVRELENTIESSVALADGEIIIKKDLPLRIVQNVENKESSYNSKSMSIFAEQEIDIIKKALLKNDGHREKTANELGISRRTLQYKLKKFGLINK
ncbi:MAG: sigma-54 dependent transcriptional regulator [Firmicutes bacterium]|jgi:DNA-binding NtrC family response regulator|nr:sigma-54 dependent transcriptional regulator [Bacillota bacterium]